ncbi:superinfection immunity protein [Massilia sp. UBA6681]|uniref:superinfection immunity protein n=1 Tax=Massilia sp. UBA6681 TaxID=1946839 RepID=UPI0025BD56B3|nr:superinfection immunity protein [Massilia sp. UBA6681]
MKDLFGFVVLVLLVVGFVLLYFWPTFRARKVGHPAFTSIFIVNLLLGWLFVPWVLTLAWAFRHAPPVPVQATQVEGEDR